MKRKIIKINQDKCNGCTLCIKACHEGAIGMINGKARLLRDDYCDGLGDCLPACPMDAISFEEREALPYDEIAVKSNLLNKETELACGCPGTNLKEFKRNSLSGKISSEFSIKSELKQWPIQIKLIPVNAPYFNDANLLIAADCTAFSYGDFHNRFIQNHITLIGCPKLDMIDYTEKLTGIITNNNIKSLKIVRMEVPCCQGIEYATKEALKASKKFIPWQVIVISTDGHIISK